MFESGGLTIKGVEDDKTTETNLFKVVAPTLTSGQKTNYLSLGGQAWTSGTGSVNLTAAGAATNIDIKMIAKGAGVFDMPGTVTTLGAMTVTDKVAIKINGATKYLAVVS